MIATTPAALSRLLRVAAFRCELEEWAGAGRVGIPLLRLSDVEPAAGACISCGEPLGSGRSWRCPTCEQAVAKVLQVPKLTICSQCGAAGSSAQTGDFVRPVTLSGSPASPVSACERIAEAPGGTVAPCSAPLPSRRS
jgi:hypothetical protein